MIVVLYAIFMFQGVVPEALAVEPRCKFGVDLIKAAVLGAMISSQGGKTLTLVTLKFKESSSSPEVVRDYPVCASIYSDHSASLLLDLLKGTPQKPSPRQIGICLAPSACIISAKTISEKALKRP